MSSTVAPQNAPALDSLTDEQLNTKLAKRIGWKLVNGKWWHDEIGDGPPMDSCGLYGRAGVLLILKALSAASVPQGNEELDPVVEAVRTKLRERSARGLAKYGTTVADNPLSREEWLHHAQEEALDLAIYLERILSDVGTKSDSASSVSAKPTTLSTNQ